jgi:ubiquinone/menaquinone biosynthesis C-methylase UbiE
MVAAPSPFSASWLVLRLCRQWVTRALADYASGRLLDVGCGAQPYRTEQAEHAARCLGLEADRSRYVETPPTVWGSALDLPFGERTFDTVFSSQVLEHVPEPARMLREMARVLRPGGCLIVTAPHIWGLHEEPHDYFRFTRFGLAHLARGAGTEPVCVQAMAGYWVTAGARFCQYLHRAEPRRLGLLLRPVYAVVQVLALILDRLHRVESDTWNYLMVARKI